MSTQRADIANQSIGFQQHGDGFELSGLLHEFPFIRWKHAREKRDTDIYGPGSLTTAVPANAREWTP